MHLCYDVTCEQALLSGQADVSLFLGTEPIPGQDLSLLCIPHGYSEEIF